MCVRSEGASPIYTRTSSSPSLHEIDIHSSRSHDSSAFTEGSETPLEMSTSQRNHLSTSGASTEFVRPPHIVSSARNPGSDVDKQSSVESTDSSSEPESCLIKDRTGVGYVSVGGCEDAHASSDGGVEVGGCEDEEVVEFCVGDVRKRLSQHSTAPKKTYQRDPEDPSGNRDSS